MKPLRYTLRLILVVSVLGLVPILFAPAGPSLTPYVSALSDLAVGDIFAAKPPPCGNKVCDFTEPDSPICVAQKHSGTNCRRFIKFGMVVCEQTAC